MATRQVNTIFAVQGESEYRAAIQKINRSIKEVNSELKLWEETYKGQESTLEAQQERTRILNDLYGKQTEKIEEVAKALKNCEDAAEKYSQKEAELQKKLKANAEEMQKMADAGDKSSEAYAKLKEENDKLQKELDNNEAKLEAAERGVTDWKIALNNAKAALEGTKNELNGTSSKLSTVGDSFDAIAGVIAAAGLDRALDAFVDSMEACIDKSIEFESAMAGVFKTVDMSLEEEAQLAENIRDMATRIPVSTTEIAGVAELAGQLGIANEDLLDFTETMVMLGTATNMSSEAAAEALAKFANIAGTSADDYDRLGATIVALGNNFATTESDITEMVTRLASTGAVVGLTESEMLAIATALSSVGIEAEAGGSAISKLMKDIESEVAGVEQSRRTFEQYGINLSDFSDEAFEAGGAFEEIAGAAGASKEKIASAQEAVSGLSGYAEVAGKSAAVFAESWERDAVGALDAFITGVGNLDESGGNAITTLEDLGLTEVRLSNAVLALGESEGILTNALDVANTAWEQNTALTDEAAQRFETTESKVQILKNSVDNLLIALGDDYLNVLEPAIEGTADLAQWLSDAADASPFLATTLASIGGALAGLTGATAAASGIKLLLSALSALSPTARVITIAATALGGLIAGVSTYVSNAEKIPEATQEWIDKNDRLVQSLTDSKTAFDETSGSIDQNREKVNQLIERVTALSEENNKTAADEAILRDAVNELNGLLPDLGLTYDELTEKINLSRQEMQEFADTVENTSKANAYASYISELTAQQEKLQIQQELTGEKIKEAQKKYEEAKKAVDAYIEEIGGEEMWNLGFGNPLKIKELEENLASATNELNGLKDSHIDIQDALKSVNSELDIARGKYDSYAAEVSGTSAVLQRMEDDLASVSSELTTELARIQDEYAKASEDLAVDQERRLEEERDRLDEALENFRDAQSEKLETYRETLSEELEAFRETQDARREELEEAQQAELDTLHEAHEEKLRLIDEEYVERLKNIDEDRYNALKEVDDQIAAIDAEVEAEKEARKEAARERKIAEAERKIEEAETREERLEAEEEYEELLADIRYEQFLEDRELKKEQLKNQREILEESYANEEAATKELMEMKKAAQLAENEAQETALIETHDKQDEILEEQLEDELKAFQKAQDDQLKAYQKRLDDVLKAYQKAQDDKIADFKVTLEEEKVLQEQEYKQAIADAEAAAKRGAEVIKSAYEFAMNSTSDYAKQAGQLAAYEYAKALAEGAGAVLESAEKLAEAAAKGLEKADAFEVGSNFATSFAKGIDETGPHAASSGTKLIKTAETAMKKEAEIASPSRKARKIGQFFGEGLALGLEDSETDVAAAVRNLSAGLDIAPEVAEKVRAAYAKIENFRGITDGGIDMEAEYRSSMNRINSIMADARAMVQTSATPIEITVINELDGEVVSKTVSRRQYRDAQTTMRVNGIKK